MTGNIVIAGGGSAGLEAAGCLAKAGLNVIVIEKEKEIGGHVKEWHHLFPDRRPSYEVTDYLKNHVVSDKITIRTGLSVSDVQKKGVVLFVSLSDGTMIKADAVLVATGFDLFKSERKEEYGYGIYDNVITAAQLEAMFRKNEIMLTDGSIPGKIGLIHCVGSRDEKVGNLYCSKLCCVTAVKQAMEIREHIPGSKVFCFYMDMRMGGAHYEELYRESQEKYGVNYIRGKVSEVSVSFGKKLVVKVEDTLAGRPLKMELDMLVLMAGMEMSEGGTLLAEKGNLTRGENRFFAPADNHFGNNLSNVKGLFFAGSCTAPMNITETISHARGAVSEIVEYINLLNK